MQIAFNWAPLKFSVILAISYNFKSFDIWSFLQWICRIFSLEETSGLGNSIFRSILPDLRRAGSRISTRLVALITLTPWFIVKPSNWLRSSSIVLCTSLSPLVSESNLFVPIASISSIKIIEGAFSRASAKASLTRLAPSPIYIWTSWGPANFKKDACVCDAHARAKSVFPIPGGPWSKTPLGGWIPRFSKVLFWVIGKTTASINSWIWLSKPPISW